MRGLGRKRLSPADAHELYEDVTPAPEPRPADVVANLPFPDPGALRSNDPGGRPSKRDRRRLDRWRRGRD